MRQNLIKFVKVILFALSAAMVVLGLKWGYASTALSLCNLWMVFFLLYMHGYKEKMKNVDGCATAKPKFLYIIMKVCTGIAIAVLFIGCYIVKSYLGIIVCICAIRQWFLS